MGTGHKVTLLQGSIGRQSPEEASLGVKVSGCLGLEGVAAKGYGVSLGDDEDVLKLDHSDGYTTVCLY